jgi:hypothetical protein
MLNLDNVVGAVKIINQQVGIGARSITISTVGVKSQLHRLAEHKLQCVLAVSLHAPNQELRYARPDYCRSTRQTTSTSLIVCMPVVISPSAWWGAVPDWFFGAWIMKQESCEEATGKYFGTCAPVASSLCSPCLFLCVFTKLKSKRTAASNIAAKTKSDQHHSSSTTAPSRKSFPARSAWLR